MNLRCLIALFVILATLASTQLLSAANRTGLSRAEIKALPITERPNRPGHFYGNTVRRQNGVVGWQLDHIGDGPVTGR